MANTTLRDYSELHAKLFIRKYGKDANPILYAGCMLGMMYEQFFKFKNRIGIYRAETQEMAAHALKGKIEADLALLMMACTAYSAMQDSFISEVTSENFASQYSEDSIEHVLMSLSEAIGIWQETQTAQYVFNRCFLLCSLLGFDHHQLFAKYHF